ncbi:hypothetical protein M422DRAFT_42825 [Sphaerobolus stellatus SS14]|nr:hypothetical protein M422DRAFT_42825 [Sphaerobolus stellatus SS14]
MSADSTLPPPADNQPYFEVSLLSAGFMDLSEHLFFTGGSTDVFKCPSMAFVLRHSASKKTVLFDLGVCKDWENYSQSMANAIKGLFNATAPLMSWNPLPRAD